MANEALALSPIPARAVSPNDAEFEAIRDAFQETARGRWFLDEYTKRNRNADTAMVLEAVARIERSLAAQKDDQQRQALSEPASVEAPASEAPPNGWPGAFAETMTAVQAIVGAARESACAALAGPAVDDALAPSRKCARVIREIAWGLRESGADGRICSLLESQVDAINAACDQVTAGALREGVLQAFDEAAQKIESICASSASPLAEPVADAQAVDSDAALFEQPEAANNVVVDLFEASAAVREASAPDVMIEMMLPAEEIPPAETTIVSAAPEAIPEPVLTAHLEIVPEPDIVPAAAAMPTLGESLIASGIVARPASSRSDPLAPIRRMSQAEKIAFFS